MWYSAVIKLVIVCSAIFLFIYSINKERKKILQSSIAELKIIANIRSQIVDILTMDKDESYPQNYIIYDIFKDQFIDFLYNKINETTESKGQNILYKGTTIDSKTFEHIVYKELHSAFISDLLLKHYIVCIQNNIQEAQNVEQQAIEYHKEFGDEPSGNPILHQSEKNNEVIQDTQEVSVEELIQTGTVEDIE